MAIITGGTMRSIVSQANELEIQKEDIVQIYKLGDQIYLVYYK